MVIWTSDTGNLPTPRWVMSSDLSAQSTEGHNFYKIGPDSKKLKDHHWRILYGDGTSAGGDVYIDAVSVGGVTSPEQAFGAASRVSSEFVEDTNNDGVMGISFSSASLSKPIPGSLIELNKKEGKRINPSNVYFQSNRRAKPAGLTTSRRA